MRMQNYLMRPAFIGLIVCMIMILYWIPKRTRVFEDKKSRMFTPKYTTDSLSSWQGDTFTESSSHESFSSSITWENSNYDYTNLPQDDFILIEHIRRDLLQKPSTQDYRLKSNIADYSHNDQAIYANDHYFHGMKGGFFVEAGAGDGEKWSNTLFFEKDLNWRGLLIEPYYFTFNSLQAINRKAYAANVALSPVPYSSHGMYRPGQSGKNSDFPPHVTPVKVIPLYSLLLAVNVTVVDFLSLDIETYEAKVLKTIPWDRVKVRLMCIAVNDMPEGEAELTNYLQLRGYKLLGRRGLDAWYGLPELLKKEIPSV